MPICICRSAKQAAIKLHTQKRFLRVVAMSSIRVYNGDGAGSRSVLSAVEKFRKAMTSGVQVSQIGPEELLAETWQVCCLALVMPGGADLPYCRRLNGKGNHIITSYVEGGGAYIGLCAGAYYASSYLEFAIGTKLEVKGPRELAFFKGKAVGPVYSGFCYESEAGAHAAHIAFRPASHGGNAAANGSDNQDASQGVAPGGNTETGRWIRCRDYSNGGPSFEPFGSSASVDPLAKAGGQEYVVLAVYTEKSNAIAAMKCSIGRGVALLVGTHPELDPKWLASQPDTVAIDQGLREESVRSDEAVRKHVRDQLERCSAERRQYFNMLMHEAGLGKYIQHVLYLPGDERGACLQENT